MKVKFLGDFRGKITNEKFFVKNAVVDFSDGRGEAVVHDNRAVVSKAKATHREDGISYAHIKEWEKKRLAHQANIKETSELIAESEQASMAGISVDELRSRKAIAAEDEPIEEVKETKPKRTRKRRTKK